MHKLHFSAGTCGSSSKETPGSFPAWSLLRQREGSRTLFSCRQLNSVREPCVVCAHGTVSAQYALPVKRSVQCVRLEDYRTLHFTHEVLKFL